MITLEKAPLAKAMNLQFTFANVIPECLKGQIALIDLALFLQITDKLDHSGLVLLGEKLIKGKKFEGFDNIIYFAKSPSYSRHCYPKKWVQLHENGLAVPKEYAYNACLEIHINEGDDYSTLCAGNISFSHSCGYYNNEDKIVHDHELYDLDDIVHLHNGETCRRDEAIFIEYEGEYYHEEDCVFTENQEWILERHSIRLANGDIYRNNDEDIQRCDDCEEYFHYDNLYYNEREDESYCSSCECNHPDSSLDRMDYSSNVLHYKGFGHTDLFINKKPVYLGLELECLVSSGYEDDVNDFTKNCKYAIATEDGSLDSNLGIEYIFRPEGLEQQKDNVEDFINEMSTNLEHGSKRYYDTDYGLHVHVSSHFLGKSTKLKIQNFVNDTFYYMQIIGGRDSTTYQDYKSCKWNDLDTKRYNFVNITNSETIEFRFPAAIIDEDHIKTNLELALAITMFCKFELKMLELKKKGRSTYNDFCKWVINNKDHYPLLTIDCEHHLIKSNMIIEQAA